MTNTTPRVLIIGVGGLGAAMVHETLRRGLQVSVLVRDEAKLNQRLDAKTIDQLATVIIGDATNPEDLDVAFQDIDVVLSGSGANAPIAHQVAQAVRRNNVNKLCWPAGSSNVKAEDGVTPAYKDMVKVWPAAAQAYEAHQICIDAIRKADITYVIMCPGAMQPAGALSPDVEKHVRIDRVAGMNTSYEDAAWVMLEGATHSTWDNQLVSIATDTL